MSKRKRKPDTKKIIISTLARFIVLAIFIGIAIYISTNAIVTNEVALAQLNGGNEAYIVQELYYKYKALIPFVGILLLGWTLYPLIRLLVDYTTKKVNER